MPANLFGKRGIDVRSQASSAASTNDPPFTITYNSADDTVTINPGVINQLLPSNMYSGAGNTPIFPLGPAAIYYIYLTCTTNGYTVISCVLTGGPTAPAAIGNAVGAAPATFYVSLGTVIGSVGDRTVYQHNTGNVSAVAKQSFLISKTGTINPGLEPFDRYYTWLLVFS